MRAIAGPEILRGFGSWSRAVGWYDGIVGAIRHPPNCHLKYAEAYENWKKHVSEGGIHDPKNGDIISSSSTPS